MDDSSQPAREPWHFDRRVPIALIAAIVLQTVAIVWWAATTDSRVANTERRVERIEANNERAQVNDALMSQRVTRVEERLDAALAILRDIQALIRDQRRGN